MVIPMVVRVICHFLRSSVQVVQRPFVVTRLNTLGPRDSRNDAYGGNFLTTAGVQVYFPVPSLMDPTRFRLGVFADAGNVFEDVDEFETSELRGSVGLEVNMFTGMGGITFSFSAPVNDDEEDETESFQFEFGTSF
jgi:outer membrane protein insertion porin family